MKKILAIMILSILSIGVGVSQTITTNIVTDMFRVVDGTIASDVPLGSVYVDVNSSSNVGLRILGSDKQLVSYRTPSSYTINGISYSNLDSCVKYLSLATSLQLEYLISNISGGGVIQSIVPGTNITVDDTDPQNPIVSASGGGGAYLPLDITDSTGVNLNSESLIFQGQNHSLALNRPYGGLIAGGAIMDGFQSISYDSVYTMSGLVSAPDFFGDTVRYPMMFQSNGLPFIDAYYKTSVLTPVIDPASGYFGFDMTLLDHNSPFLAGYLFSDIGFILTRLEDSVFEVDLRTGDVSITNNVIGDEKFTHNDSLQLVQKFYVDSLGKPTVHNVTAPTFNIPISNSAIVKILADSSDYVYLPNLSLNAGMSVFLVNKSNDDVDVYSLTANEIWNNGVTSSSIILPSGTTMRLINDGDNWSVY